MVNYKQLSVVILLAILAMGHYPMHVSLASTNDLVLTLSVQNPSVAVSEPIIALVTISTTDSGCPFHIMELSLLKGDQPYPVAVFNSPAKLNASQLSTTNTFTLTGIYSGTILLKAAAFGEESVTPPPDCMGFSWSNRESNTVTVTVTGTGSRFWMPLIHKQGST